MNNVLEERDEDVTRRQRIKKRLDNIINLSESDSTARLLDEGAVVSGDDSIRFIIKKGAMQKFMSEENQYLPNIDADYKGFINLGHEDFYANPTSLIGEWSKSDLKLVDIGNDRHGLDVDIRLWDWHPTVQLLHQLPYSVGVSAEFLGHVDYEASDELGYLVYDEICIMDFAVVGNGANANSNGLMLKGENMNNVLKKLQATFEDAEVKEEAEAVAEEVVEEEVEELTEETEETEEAVEEEAEEEAEAEEAAEEETVEIEVDTDALSEVMEKIDSLVARIEELENENANLKESLSEKSQEIKDFVDKFPKLTMSLNPALKAETKTNEVEVSRYGNSNDGIGV